MSRKKSGIIFDMDGTLIDSIRLTLPAFQKACPEFGIPMPEHQTVFSAVGIANPYFYYEIFPDIEKEHLNRFGHRVEQYEKEYIKTEKKLVFDGIADTIRLLFESGYPLYVASTGDKEHVESCLAAGRLTPYFKEICYGEPDKEQMVEGLIARHANHQWVMIGDTIKDINAARHNGIPVIGAGYGYCHEDLKEKFDWIADFPSAVPGIIAESVFV